jgi:signal transduction histidine kinase
MSITKQPSLIARLIRWQALAMTLCCAILLLHLYVQMTSYGNGDLDKRMSYFAQILAETAASAKGTPVEAAPRLKAVETIFVKGFVEMLDGNENYVANYEVLNASGETIYQASNAALSTLLPGLGFGDVTIGDERFRVVRVQSSDGAITVIAAESASVRQASIWPLLKIIGTSQLIIFLVCVAALWLATRLSFRPIMRLAKQIAERPAGELTPIDGSYVYSEIAPLVDELNGLLRREDERLNTERGFLADAAHELRTPLAAVSLQADQLLASTTQQDRGDAATQLQAGVARLSHLLKQLLTVARVDASSAFTSSTMIDAAELLRQSMAEFSREARRKSITIELNAPDHLEVLASAVGLNSIFDNLLDNAVRYTPLGGTVSVTLARSGDGIDLTVMDDGPGIDPALRERVFERFYRIPGSEATGSGLGLAIVRKIAQAHGAAVKLGTGLQGRGLAVQLRLPTEQP